MKFVGKHFGEKGITLILLIFIIIIMVAIVSMIVKGVFDKKTMGMTSDTKLVNEEVVGKYIKYTPEEGIYETVTNNSKYTGNANNTNNFITDTSLNWRIWSIDESKITLISDIPVSVGGYKNIGALNLSNCSGYNNSVKILNEICKNCYSNSEIGAISRSLNIEDIEKVLNKSVWNPETFKAKKKEAIAYSGRKEYKINICYPYIYGVERYANIDGIEILEEEGIQRSNQNTLCNVNSTYLKANTSLSAAQTAWSNSNMTLENFVDENYYYMVFNEGFNKRETLMSYFLASRAVDLTESVINFDVFEVSMGKSIQTNTLFNSRGGSLEYWDRVRPIVEIPLNKISIDRLTDGMTQENAWEIRKIEER